MNDLDKMKHLIAHWIEHGKEHAAAYEEWAAKIQDLDGGKKKAETLREAAKKAYESVACLENLPYEHGHLDHPHDHDHHHGHCCSKHEHK
jgi:hypothetical protein